VVGSNKIEKKLWEWPHLWYYTKKSFHAGRENLTNPASNYTQRSVTDENDPWVDP
jgi:hypothetical protein